METTLARDEDVELLLNDVCELYGYDFTGYSRASVKRRIGRLILIDKFASFAELRYRVRTDADYVRRFVEEITVNVTEMFRDPGFYRTIREEIIPVLATRPFIRIWHAGCSTGEEVYSMAILLKEANLLHKSLIYATDLNPGVLEKARKGIFPLNQMKQYSENYILSGGKKEFSAYYTAKYDWAKLNDDLKEKMIISTHNLVSDGSFNEFQLILCRNVLIYFDRILQDRVLSLFNESLEKLGFLALGAKESLKFSVVRKQFAQLENKEKIWRKIE
ncbi:MAG: protein-glutamate O-methyltransferase CheR [Bacteroidetes bacterium]|nr:protein-glutamate O-methyltransferase CheR [Bacteroidota bacterium]